MLIRRERPGDAGRVWAVHRAAFDTATEADLAAALREGGHAIAELSLVAELDGDVVGHVVCSRGHIGGGPAVGLGPIAVLPEHQGRGVGSALVHAVLGAADALGEPLVALLGSPDYYHRFGFVASAELGIEAPDPAWGAYFQVRPLSGHEPTMTGPFTYAPPFDDA